MKIEGTVAGEVWRSKDIGGKGYTKWIWLPCQDCGKKRWVQIIKVETLETRAKRCANCAAKEKGKSQKGRRTSKFVGRFITNGYVQVWLASDNFFRSMANDRGYVAEHRLVVAKALGRCLHRWEIVHHKGVKYPKDSIENKQDNRYPENLQLVTDDRHKQITILETRITRLEKRVTLLEAENILLKTELKQYQTCEPEEEV